MASRKVRLEWVFLMGFAILPLLDALLPQNYRIADSFRTIFIFAVLGLSVNLITGYTGLLNLGAAGFMAIGSYTFAILTCDIYPFQCGFLLALALSALMGFGAGILLGFPTLRLRGDYLAIVTLGFGEIVQNSLRNLETITKGTQGINPLPAPAIFGLTLSQDSYLPSYFLFLIILALAVFVIGNLERSPVGRSWMAVREDELAARAMGVDVAKAKLLSFAFGAALAAVSGALWASFLGSSGEPGNYDFQVSIIALCIVIVGGMGNISGVLLGSLIMVGFNSIVLVKISEALARMGIQSSGSVFFSPNNWKFMIFGLALVLMMRYRPEGLLSSKRIRSELQRS